MARNNLFDPGVLRRLALCGTRVIERVPSENDVIFFLNELDAYADGPLFNHFSALDRDGTTAITHLPRQLPGQPPPAFQTHLLTNVQDYTRRSESTFASRWDKPIKIDNPHVIDDVIDKHFSTLQTHILRKYDPFLHQLYYFENKWNKDPPTFVVETARRYKAGDEPEIGKADISGWPDQSNFARRRARSDEITLWAVLMLVPPDAKHDAARLAFIRAAIRAVASSRGVTAALRPLNRVEGFNLHHLLRARHAQYLDGRARFPLVRAAVMDQSLLRPSAAHAEYARENHGKRPRIVSVPPGGGGTVPELPRKKNNLHVVVLVPLLTLLSSSAGFAFLIRLDSSDNPTEIVGIAFALFFGMMMPCYYAWQWVFTRSFDAKLVAAAKVPLTAKELMRAAEQMDEPTNRGMQVRAVLTPVCRHYYDGAGLSFSPIPYDGEVLFERKRFSVQELLLAGYEMGFAMDGREVLIAPPPGRETMRLESIDEDGRCTFKELKGEIKMESQFIFRARGTWWRNVEVGY